MPVQDIKRTITAFSVKPALYGGYGLYGTGVQSIDGGPPVPFLELFAVGSDPQEIGTTLTSMLEEIKNGIPEAIVLGADEPGADDPTVGDSTGA